MSNSGAIFKPRQFGGEGPSRKSFLADSTLDSVTYHQAQSGYVRSELTKNDKYCVSRLPALPPILSNDHMSDSSGLLNGYADGKTEFALVVSERSINVWPYNSSDDTPISFEFPLGESNQDALQLAILTRSSPGTSLDPGLVIINSLTGHVRFYESVQHAPALGMINSKSIETTLSILSSLGEYITLAENVEPAGIVVATSWKRVVLIILRDHKGAPKLSSLELTKPSTSSRLFSGWIGSHDDELTDEIVSLKSGVTSSHGTQEIIVQDASGTFKKYVYQASSTGTPIINYKKTLLYRLASSLENVIDGFFPGAVLDAKFLDLWPAFCSSSESSTIDLYIALVCVKSSLQSTKEERLALVTMQINESGVMIIGSHQLPKNESSHNLSLVSKPKLFIPKPGASAFVVIGNTVILCDLKSEAPKTTEFVYYKPKWEDSIKFKPSLQVIGCGYEDKVRDEENAALLFITSEFGVVRIERFENSYLDNNVAEDDATNPVNLVKSHIQQAIYFSDSSFVDFNIGSNYPDEVITEAVNAVTAEIMQFSSPYLPTYFSSTRDSFALRLKLLHELIAFVKANFHNSWFDLYPKIIDVLEKIECALNLWNMLDLEDAEAKTLKSNVKKILAECGFASSQSGSDVLRSYFEKDVSSILEVLTNLIENNVGASLPPKFLLKLLLVTLHDSVYTNELKYIAPNVSIAPRKLWIFNSNLIVKAEELISRTYCTEEYIQKSSSRDEFVKFTATLYYLISSAVIYMDFTNDEQLQEYQSWFEHRRSDWMRALLNNGLLREALEIAERYKDFSSVARVLEKERELSSPEFILDKIALYMSEYGYAFASKLFEFRIEQDQIQRLLLEFGDFNDYLNKFFEENPIQTGTFSWIHYLRSKNFDKASQALVTMAARKDLENQPNREFGFSMAKLSAIAAEADGSSIENSFALEELVIDAESNLVVIRIQNKTYNYISQFMQDKKEIITLDYFLDNFANQKIQKSKIAEDIEPFFQRFVDQKALSKKQLAILLSSINPISQLSTVFADALIVAALITNDSEFRAVAGLVWAKLLVKTDDWSTLTATGDNTDEVNKIKIRESVLYKTLQEVIGNSDILSALNIILRDHMVASDSEIVDFKYWIDQVHKLKQKVDVEKWVNIIQAEARM